MMKMSKPGRGQTLVEYALMLPILILIVIMLVDLGRAVYYYSVVFNAAREGARWGIIDPEDTAGIEAAAKAKITGINPADVTVVSAMPTEDTIRVTVSYSFAPVTPLVGNFLSGGTLTLQSQSTMQVEG
jgi:Flp pilus assembly protein TadG